MVGIAAFNGVTDVLMLSGSLYMLQVYDRLIPSRKFGDVVAPVG
jgi:ATP-binding cassette subfamily C protein PrsD